MANEKANRADLKFFPVAKPPDGPKDFISCLTSEHKKELGPTNVNWLSELRHQQNEFSRPVSNQLQFQTPTPVPCPTTVPKYAPPLPAMTPTPPNMPLGDEQPQKADKKEKLQGMSPTTLQSVLHTPYQKSGISSPFRIPEGMGTGSLMKRLFKTPRSIKVGMTVGGIAASLGVDPNETGMSWTSSLATPITFASKESPAVSEDGLDTGWQTSVGAARALFTPDQLTSTQDTEDSDAPFNNTIEDEEELTSHICMEVDNSGNKIEKRKPIRVNTTDHLAKEAGIRRICSEEKCCFEKNKQLPDEEKYITMSYTKQGLETDVTKTAERLKSEISKVGNESEQTTKSECLQISDKGIGRTNQVQLCRDMDVRLPHRPSEHTANDMDANPAVLKMFDATQESPMLVTGCDRGNVAEPVPPMSTLNTGNPDNKSPQSVSLEDAMAIFETPPSRAGKRKKVAPRRPKLMRRSPTGSEDNFIRVLIKSPKDLPTGGETSHIDSSVTTLVNKEMLSDEKGSQDSIPKGNNKVFSLPHLKKKKMVGPLVPDDSFTQLSPSSLTAICEAVDDFSGSKRTRAYNVEQDSLVSKSNTPPKEVGRETCKSEVLARTALEKEDKSHSITTTEDTELHHNDFLFSQISPTAMNVIMKATDITHTAKDSVVTSTTSPYTEVQPLLKSSHASEQVKKRKPVTTYPANTEPRPLGLRRKSKRFSYPTLSQISRSSLDDLSVVAKDVSTSFTTLTSYNKTSDRLQAENPTQEKPKSWQSMTTLINQANQNNVQHVASNSSSHQPHTPLSMSSETSDLEMKAPCESALFEGFHTASNKTIVLSEDALKKATVFVQKAAENVTQSNKHLVKHKQENSFGFATASNEEVIISTVKSHCDNHDTVQSSDENHIELTSEIGYIEEPVVKFTVDNAMEWQGVKTESKKNDTVSENPVEREMIIRSEEDIKSDTLETFSEMASNSVSENVGKDINVESKITSVAEVGRNNQHFNVANGKSGGEKTTVKSQEEQITVTPLYGKSELQTVDKANDQAPQASGSGIELEYSRKSSSGFQFASGKTIDLSSESLLKARQLMNDVEQETDLSDRITLSKSASGKGLTNSAKAQKNVMESTKTMGTDPKQKKSVTSAVLSEEPFGFLDFQSASGKNIQSTATAQQKALQIFNSINEELEKSHSETLGIIPNPVTTRLSKGFQSASGKTITLSNESEKKAMQIMQEIEIEVQKDIVGKYGEVSTRTTGQETVKRQIDIQNIPEDLLNKDNKTTLRETRKEGKVPLPTTCGGFQSASGKNIKVSVEGQRKAIQIMKELDSERTVDRFEGGSFESPVGFQSASGKPITLSDNAQLRAKLIMDEIDRDAQLDDNALLLQNAVSEKRDTLAQKSSSVNDLKAASEKLVSCDSEFVEKYSEYTNNNENGLSYPIKLGAGSDILNNNNEKMNVGSKLISAVQHPPKDYSKMPKGFRPFKAPRQIRVKQSEVKEGHQNTILSKLDNNNSLDKDLDIQSNFIEATVKNDDSSILLKISSSIQDCAEVTNHSAEEDMEVTFNDNIPDQAALSKKFGETDGFDDSFDGYTYTQLTEMTEGVATFFHAEENGLFNFTQSQKLRKHSDSKQEFDDNKSHSVVMPQENSDHVMKPLHPVTADEDVNCQQNLNQNEQTKSVDFGSGFSLASGKVLQISENALKTAQTFIESMKEDEINAERTSCNTGVSLASRKQTCLASEKVKNADMLNDVTGNILNTEQSRSLSGAIQFNSLKSSCTAGFSLASGKPVNMSEEALEKANIFMASEEKESTSSNKMVQQKTVVLKTGTCNTGFSLASGKNIKLSENSLERAHKLIDEAEKTYLNTLQSTSDFNISTNACDSGFGFALGKQVALSETVLDKAKKSLEDIEEHQEGHSLSKKEETVTDICNIPIVIQNKEELGTLDFHTANGKSVSVIDKRFYNGKAFLESEFLTAKSPHSPSQGKEQDSVLLDREGPTSLNRTGDTTLTDSKSCSPGEESFHKKQYLNEQVEKNDTASEAQSIAVKQVANVRDGSSSENMDMHEGRYKQMAFSGFQTAAGKKVAISDGVLEQARILVAAAMEEDADNYFESTVKNNKLMETKALHGKDKCTILEKNISISREIHAAKSMVVKGGGGDSIVNDASLSKINQELQTKVKQDSIIVGHSDIWDDSLDEEMCRMDGSGDHIKPQEYSENHKVDISNPMQTVVNKGIVVEKYTVETAEGSKFDEIKYVGGNEKHTFMFNTDKQEASSCNTPRGPVKFVGFQTANGTTVTVSNDALKKARGLLAEREEIEDEMSLGQPYVNAKVDGFQTANGTKVKVSNDALKKARGILTEVKEMEDEVPSLQPKENAKFGGFQTANGTKVKVSNDALKKARGILTEVDEMEDILPSLQPKVNAKFGGFQTANGIKVKVSNDALKKARGILTEVDEMEGEVPSLQSNVNAKFGGFQTAKKKKVPTATLR